MKPLVHTTTVSSGLPSMIHLLASVLAVCLCVLIEAGGREAKIDVAARDFAQLQKAQARLDFSPQTVPPSGQMVMQSRNQPRLVLAYLP